MLLFSFLSFKYGKPWNFAVLYETFYHKSSWCQHLHILPHFITSTSIILQFRSPCKNCKIHGMLAIEKQLLYRFNRWGFDSSCEAASDSSGIGDRGRDWDCDFWRLRLVAALVAGTEDEPTSSESSSAAQRNITTLPEISVIKRNLILVTAYHVENTVQTGLKS